MKKYLILAVLVMVVMVIGCGDRPTSKDIHGLAHTMAYFGYIMAEKGKSLDETHSEVTKLIKQSYKEDYSIYGAGFKIRFDDDNTSLIKQLPPHQSEGERR